MLKSKTALCVQLMADVSGRMAKYIEASDGGTKYTFHGYPEVTASNCKTVIANEIRLLRRELLELEKELK